MGLSRSLSKKSNKTGVVHVSLPILLSFSVFEKLRAKIASTATEPDDNMIRARNSQKSRPNLPDLLARPNVLR